MWALEPKKTNVRPKDPNWKDLLKLDLSKPELIASILFQLLNLKTFSLL